MKFAIIRKECSFHMGGAERYAANLSKALANLGHTVYMLADRCDDDIHPDLIHIPIPVSRRSSWAKNLSFHENSQKALKGLGAEVVLALSRSFPASAFRVSDPLHNYWMSIRYPGKFHSLLQKFNPRHRAILSLEKGIFKPSNTRFIITNSAFSKRLIQQTFAFPLDRVYVIYNGVDLTKFSLPAVSLQRTGPDIVRLLFVGQDFKRKGLVPLIKSLVEVKSRGYFFRLRVVGRDNAKPYKSLASQYGLEDWISFEGVSSSIQHVYQASDLLVLPSLYDPFANVCLESMACGLPVLTTTTNGSSEILQEGENGFILDGEASELVTKLASTISRFCAMSIEERENMRWRARQRAEEFTIEENAQKVVELFS